MNRTIDAIRDALSVLFPVDCAGCGLPQRALCVSCAAHLIAEVTPRQLPDGSAVFTALLYEAEIRSMLLALKEHGRTDVARSLGLCLTEAIERAKVEDAEIVTIPASRAAMRRRGYDPVALMVRKAGFRRSRILSLTRVTSTQKSLSVSDREQNRRDSMRALRSLDGRRFVIVDDVVTTGATLIEARRALTRAGGEVIGAAALAFTSRHKSAGASEFPNQFGLPRKYE
jgi:ComF family protein